MITGITRVRNEALIIEDTLRHYLQFCATIIIYDDCSTDETVDIAKSFDRVQVIQGTFWHADRPREETRHRALLLAKVQTPWTLCFDADERLMGNLPDLKANAYRFRLFDGYMTQYNQEPYRRGSLLALSRMWGPEFRDIIMLFKTAYARYYGLDRREPVLKGSVLLADVYVKHFGKCLSVEHWEETCEYYATHWPEPYHSKWEGRRGKAIHTESDFERPLYNWAELMADKSLGVRL